MGDRKVDPFFVCEGILFGIFTQVVHPVDWEKALQSN